MSHNHKLHLWIVKTFALAAQDFSLSELCIVDLRFITTWLAIGASYNAGRGLSFAPLLFYLSVTLLALAWHGVLVCDLVSVWRFGFWSGMALARNGGSAGFQIDDDMDSHQQVPQILSLLSRLSFVCLDRIVSFRLSRLPIVFAEVGQEFVLAAILRSNLIAGFSESPSSLVLG